MDKTPQRKGALRLADIPAEIKDQLNKGEIPTVNLTEWLAVDHPVLLKSVLTNLRTERYIQTSLRTLDTLKPQTSMQYIAAIGQALLAETTKDNNDTLLPQLTRHPSDSVRCWAAYMVGLDPNLSIRHKLDRIRSFAADSHFGVREIAWMAVRQSIVQNLPEAIAILSTWAVSEDPNIRRFASESTRITTKALRSIQPQ